ncbi:hypothetical protein ACHQM5_001732 [Ranunculus cassubicifolius]
MATSRKYERFSRTPDKVTYPGGKRGSYTTTSSSGSHHEDAGNRTLTTLPRTSRSTSTLSKTDVSTFLNGLPLDWKILITDHKFPEGDLTSVMNATLGISLGDLSSTAVSTILLSTSSLEELKQAKTNLHDRSVRARDRVRVLNEAGSRFDEFLHDILPRNKSRSNDQSSDRRHSSASLDSGTFGSVGRTGTQSQTSALDFEVPKLEEKTKSMVPNRRTRTYLLDAQIDARANTLSRSYAPNENDREISGLVGASQSEDKDLPISDSVDGWEKSKVRKKRSGIKSSRSTVLNRLVDGDLESKNNTQQKPSNNVRSRRSTSHGFRKAGLDLGMCSAPEYGQDNEAQLNDRRDHIVASDKERVTMETSKRSSPSRSSKTKINSVTWALRSSPRTVPKASPNVHQSSGVNDNCELSPRSNKLHTVAGDKDTEHISQARSSSPPLAQWVGQRSQKRTRAARRPNFVPPAPDHDETPTLDVDSNISGSDTVLRRFNGRSSRHPPQQVILKDDRVSSAALSESKESGAAEIKFKDKSKRSGGVPRQGRTARGSDSMNSGHLMSVEMRGRAATAKQLRNSALSSDNNESKTSHPPTRKLSEGRDCTQRRHSVKAEIPDFQGEADDGHEELLAAATSAVNTAHACSSKFWKQMEAIFGFVSSDDIAYIKEQGNDFSLPNPGSLCEEDSVAPADGFYLTKDDEDNVLTNGAEKVEHLSEQLIRQNRVCNVPSLFQRLLSAFILEEEEEAYSGREEEDYDFDVYGSTIVEDVESKGDSCSQQSFGNIQTSEKPVSNGYKIPTTEGYLDDLENGDFVYNNMTEDIHVEKISNCHRSLNGFQPGQAPMTSVACKQSQYDQMSINERLRLELESIGICSESVTEDEEITEDISRLQEKLHKQLLKKRQLIHKLEKSVVEAKELQERDIEHRAFDKLVGIAYEKYMNCWGPNASCGRGTRAKIAKQAALSFVKQTIERCHNFENRNESCFNEPACMDIFHSVASLAKIAEEGEVTDIPPKGDLCLDTEAIDLSKLQLPDMDLLGGGDGEQGQDLASWLDIDDDGLQDFDSNGLDIPMDDLTDLHMTV